MQQITLTEDVKANVHIIPIFITRKNRKHNVIPSAKCMLGQGKPSMTLNRKGFVRKINIERNRDTGSETRALPVTSYSLLCLVLR